MTAPVDDDDSNGGHASFATIPAVRGLTPLCSGFMDYTRPYAPQAINSSLLDVKQVLTK